MILSYIADKLADGGMKMLKEIPSLVMKGWEKAKELLSFWKDSKDKPGGERALSFWEEMCKKYEELVEDSGEETAKAEAGIDTVVTGNGKDEVAKAERDHLKKEMPNVAPSAGQIEVASNDEIPKRLPDEVTRLAGKTATPETAQEAMRAGVTDVTVLRKMAGNDFNKFVVLVEKYMEKFPSGLVSLVTMRDSEGKIDSLKTLDMLKPFGFGLFRGSRDLKKVKEYFAADSISDNEISEIVVFIKKFFLENTESNKVAEIVKELHKNRNNLSAPKVLASVLWKIDKDDLTEINKKLGGELVS